VVRGADTSQQKADAAKDEAKGKIMEIDGIIAQEEANRKNASARSAQKIDEKVKNLKEQRGEFSNMINEIETMEKSKQVYSLVSLLDQPGNYTLYGDGNKLASQPGGTYYRDGKVVMEYRFGNSAARAHELKHGFQFETGQISFNVDGSPGLLHDLNDEVAAYRREDAFTLRYGKPLINRTTSKMTSYYSNLPKIDLSVKTLTESVKGAYFGNGYQIRYDDEGKSFQDAKDEFFKGQVFMRQ